MSMYATRLRLSMAINDDYHKLHVKTSEWMLISIEQNIANIYN